MKIAPLVSVIWTLYSLINTHEIFIDSCNISLQNENYFENGSGSSARFDYSSAPCLVNLNGHKVVNSGLLFLKSEDAISNNGELKNHDSLIVIGSVANTGTIVNSVSAFFQIDSAFVGIENFGIFTNDFQLTIRNFEFKGIHNYSSLQNNGQIEISDNLVLGNVGISTGVLNEGDLVNNRQLSIHNISGIGIENKPDNGRCLTNNDTIDILNIEEIGFLQNTGCTLNQGSIFIENSPNGFHLGLDFSGPGNLQNEKAYIRSSSSEEEVASVLNTANAKIQVSNCNQIGIKIFMNGIFTNQANGLLGAQMITGIPLDIELGVKLTCDGEINVSN